MKLKSFTRTAQITRTPGSVDFYPGQNQIKPDDEKNPEMWYQKNPYSQMTNTWTGQPSAGMPRGMSKEQIFLQLQRERGMTPEQFNEMIKKEKDPEAKAALADTYIHLLVTGA